MAHAGGRPLKFKTVEELKERIDRYFFDCATNGTPLMITGLAYALDTSRQTLLEYEGEVEGREKAPEYADAIKKAKLRIEMDYERRLIENGRAGDIFGLKNFGWRDRFETDVTSNGKTIAPLLGGSSNTDPNDEKKD